MTPELSRQLGRLLSLSQAKPQERELIIEAAGADGVQTVQDLSEAAQELVARLEERVARRRAALAASS